MRFITSQIVIYRNRVPSLAVPIAELSRQYLSFTMISFGNMDLKLKLKLGNGMAHE